TTEAPSVAATPSDDETVETDGTTAEQEPRSRNRSRRSPRHQRVAGQRRKAELAAQQRELEENAGTEAVDVTRATGAPSTAASTVTTAEISEETVTESVVAEEVVTEETATEETAADETVPEEAATKEAVPEEAATKEAAPEEVIAAPVVTVETIGTATNGTTTSGHSYAPMTKATAEIRSGDYSPLPAATNAQRLPFSK